MPNFGTSEYVLYKLWYAPAVSPELGAQRKLGAPKKISGAKFVPPTSKLCQRL